MRRGARRRFWSGAWCETPSPEEIRLTWMSLLPGIPWPSAMRLSPHWAAPRS